MLTQRRGWERLHFPLRERGAASPLLSLAPVASGIRSPKDVHVLILEYVILRDKEDFADVIKLKNSEMGDYPGLSGWT